MQIQRVLGDVLQLRVGGQIHRCRWVRLRLQLVQEGEDTGGIAAAVGDGEGNRLGHQLGRIATVQLQHRDERAHPRPIRVALLKAAEQALIVGGPLVAPLAQGFGMIKGTGALLQEGQIMQRIEDILLPVVAARVASDQLLIGEDGDCEGGRFEDEGRPGLIDRHGIAVGLEAHLAVAIQAHRVGDGIVEGLRRQRPPPRLFVLPGRANRLGLALDDAVIVALATGEQVGVQIGIAGDLRNGDEIHPPGEAHAVFDAAFLLGFLGGAKVAGEERVAAEEGKGLLFGPGAALHADLECGGEVVIADAVGDTAKEVEGGLMPSQERLLALGGKGHHEGAPGIAEGHHKDLHGDTGAVQVDLGVPPIDLGILTRVKLQGQKGTRALVLLAEVAHIGAHGRGTAGEALRLHELEDARGGVALLGRHLGILVKQLVNALAVGIQLRGLPGHALGVARALGRLQGFLDGIARDAQLTGDLAHTRLVNIIGVADSRLVIHSHHLLILSRATATTRRVDPKDGMLDHYSPVKPTGGWLTFKIA